MKARPPDAKASSSSKHSNKALFPLRHANTSQQVDAAFQQRCVCTLRDVARCKPVMLWCMDVLQFHASVMYACSNRHHIHAACHVCCWCHTQLWYCLVHAKLPCLHMAKQTQHCHIFYLLIVVVL